MTVEPEIEIENLQHELEESERALSVYAKHMTREQEQAALAELKSTIKHPVRDFPVMLRQDCSIALPLSVVEKLGARVDQHLFLVYAHDFNGYRLLGAEGFGDLLRHADLDVDEDDNTAVSWDLEDGCAVCDTHATVRVYQGDLCMGIIRADIRYEQGGDGGYYHVVKLKDISKGED